MAQPDDIVEQARSAGVRVELLSGLDPIRTVVEASNALDRPLAQVGNTVLLTVRGDPVLVIVPGDRRIHGGLVAEHYGARALDVSLATQQEIREHTGHGSTMIPPFGLSGSIDVLVDERLMEHETVLLPSGDPHALIAVRSDDLANLAVADVGDWSTPLDPEDG